MLILSILFLLVSNAVTLRRDMSILYSRVAIIAIIYCTMLALNSMDVYYIDKGISLYGGLFCITTITQSFHIFIFVISSIIIQLTAFYPRKIWHETLLAPGGYGLKLINKFTTLNGNVISKMSNNFKIIEYPLILLFIIAGATLLISSSDIVSVFLSIELQSYGLYLLCTIYRNSESSTSAGLTYFLLGGLSSCFILLGSSLLYINYGTTNLDACYIITTISSVAETNQTFDTTIGVTKSLYINLSLLIMSVGFLFKISAAPFHFWSPDVYDAIPTIVTTAVAILAKVSILVFLLEIIYYTSTTSTTDFNWKFGLILSSFASLIVGTVLGLTEPRIKRLLAFSTISHLGFILMGLSIADLESSQAFIFYLMQYTVSNLNVFLLLIAIGYTFYNYINDINKYNKLLDRNNSPVQYINQLKGYYSINPVLALSFIITLFSFVGIPPLIGFFGKQVVLSVAIANNYLFLALIGILTSVISAVYYLGLVKQIFFDPCDYSLNEKFNTINIPCTIDKSISLKQKLSSIKLSSFLSINISILTLIIIVFIINPNEWLNAVQIIALSLNQP